MAATEPKDIVRRLQEVHTATLQAQSEGSDLKVLASVLAAFFGSLPTLLISLAVLGELGNVFNAEAVIGYSNAAHYICWVAAVMAGTSPLIGLCEFLSRVLGRDPVEGPEGKCREQTPSDMSTYIGLKDMKRSKSEPVNVGVNPKCDAEAKPMIELIKQMQITFTAAIFDNFIAVYGVIAVALLRLGAGIDYDGGDFSGANNTKQNIYDDNQAVRVALDLLLQVFAVVSIFGPTFEIVRRRYVLRGRPLRTTWALLKMSVMSPEFTAQLTSVFAAVLNIVDLVSIKAPDGKFHNAVQVFAFLQAYLLIAVRPMLTACSRVLYANGVRFHTADPKAVFLVEANQWRVQWWHPMLSLVQQSNRERMAQVGEEFMFTWCVSVMSHLPTLVLRSMLPVSSINTLFIFNAAKEILTAVLATEPAALRELLQLEVLAGAKPEEQRYVARDWPRAHLVAMYQARGLEPAVRPDDSDEHLIQRLGQDDRTTNKVSRVLIAHALVGRRLICRTPWVGHHWDVHVTDALCIAP